VGESSDLKSDLIDVTGIDLDQLMALPDSVLTESLRRIFQDGSKPANHYAVFQSSIG
jgi:FXSXX-COOH protein